MAVPKRKTSKTRRDKRRATHDRLTPVQFTTCPSCDEPKLPHRICLSCGQYAGREVLALDSGEE